MLKIGPVEVVIILAIVLLIFGPTKLPQLAKSIGRSVVELKDGLRGAKDSKEQQDSAPPAGSDKS